MKVIYNSTLPFQQSISKFSLKFFLTLALTTFSIFAAFSQCTDNYVQIGSYHVEFVEVRYDFPNEGQSTWYYNVEATSGKDISHVTFPLDLDCIDVLDSGVWGETTDELFSGQGQPNVGKDPKAKIYGMKFDQSIKRSKDRNYYFTLDKNLAVEPMDKMAIKAGRPFYFGTICGPSGDCNEAVDEPMESCISGQTFNDANKNGVRDAGELPIEGVTVQLMYQYGVWDQVVTGADGTYSFCGLDITTYAVRMTAETGYILTGTNIGDDEFDNDISDRGFSHALIINADGDQIENIDGGWFMSSGGGGTAFEVFQGDEFSIHHFNTNKTTPSFPNTMVDYSPVAVTTVDMQIFPNPVVDVATFKTSISKTNDVIIEIRDQNFSLIMKTTIGQYETEQSLYLGDLPNGVYFANIITGKTSSIKKIVKAN